MRVTLRRNLGISVAGLIFISLACKAISFGGPDIEATIQAGIIETQAAQTDNFQEEIPPAKTGEIISAGAVEVFIPPEYQDQPPAISAVAVTEALPPAPDESTSIGQAYEITSQSELSGPVLISISYDPDALSPGVSEENLYIATLIRDEWQVVPDGYVDTANHTVNVSVEHFSFFGIFQSAAAMVYDAVQAAIGDEISSEYFGDLPQQIRYEFYDLEIKPQNVTAVVHAKLSLTTKAASGMISFGNLVSKTAGLAIGAIEGVEDLAWAMGEMIFAEVGDYATDSTAGSFIVSAYDSFDLGREIGKYAYELKDANPSKAAAMASAWILAREMEYINKNMDPAFKDLWKFNTLSGSRLDVYAVYFDAVPWKEELGLGASGVKFYYYDDSNDEWVNYYNDVFVWKMTFEAEEIDDMPQADEREAEQAPENVKPTNSSKPQATVTPKPTSTPRPTDTPKPTNTPVPTNTPIPTNTPEPTYTPEPDHDVVVILRWFSSHDADLFVTDPFGDRITWAYPESWSGGYHHGDAPDECSDFHTYLEERVSWPGGNAPPGEYKVEVKYHGNHCMPGTDYIEFEVTMIVDGVVVDVFTGTTVWEDGINSDYPYTIFWVED